MSTDPGLFGRPLDHRSRPRPTEAISDGYRAPTNPPRCPGCRGDGWRIDGHGAIGTCECQSPRVTLPCGLTAPADGPLAAACPCGREVPSHAR
jgi:hypothetical protein